MCLYLLALESKAQININIPIDNIRNRNEYQQEFSGGTYPSVLGLVPGVNIRANTTSFINSSTNMVIPLNLANIKLVSIGSITLVNSNFERALSTSYQSLYSGLASVLPGAVIGNARFVINNYTWRSGTYSSVIEFNNTGLLVGQMQPRTQIFNIIVPNFILSQNTISTTELLVNDLNFFRNTSGINANKTVNISTTVSYIPQIQTVGAQFNFGITTPYNNLPNTSVNNVMVTLSGTPAASSINLSTTPQALSTAGGIEVPTNNSQNLMYNFAINGASLKSNFLQAGNYSVPLIFTWNNAPLFPNTSAPAINSTLEVKVGDLGEIIANQTAVDLIFATAQDYQNGVNKDMPAHLRLSKTTPYNLYVRATDSQFSSGANGIPLDVLRIGPMAGEAGVNVVTLSTTPQQLINAANPVVDRSLSLRYSIPANETFKLLNKPNGIYSTDIIFSFVAP